MPNDEPFVVASFVLEFCRGRLWRGVGDPSIPPAAYLLLSLSLSLSLSCVGLLPAQHLAIKLGIFAPALKTLYSGPARATIALIAVALVARII